MLTVGAPLATIGDALSEVEFGKCRMGFVSHNID